MQYLIVFTINISILSVYICLSQESQELRRYFNLLCYASFGEAMIIFLYTGQKIGETFALEIMFNILMLGCIK